MDQYRAAEYFSISRLVVGILFIFLSIIRAAVACEYFEPCWPFLTIHRSAAVFSLYPGTFPVALRYRPEKMVESTLSNDGDPGNSRPLRTRFIGTRTSRKAEWPGQ